MTNAHITNEFSDEISLKELISYIVKGKYIIISFIAVSFLLSLKIISSAPVKYEASITASEFKEELGANDNGFNAGGLVGQVLKISSVKSSSFAVMIEKMSSLKVAHRLNEKHNLIKKIYENSWDEEKQEWRKPRKRFEHRLKSLFNIPYWSPPNESNLSVYIKTTFAVEDIIGTDMKVISFRHTDPEFAVFLLSSVFFETDNLMREEAKKQLYSQRDFIEKSLENEHRPIFKQTFLNLLLNVEQKIMLINSDNPFVAQIVDGPAVSSLPVEPKPLLIMFICLIAGVGLGLISSVCLGLIIKINKED